MDGVGPLFQRQFLLSREPTQAPAEFVHRRVPAGHLYHSPALPVLGVTGPDGHEWTLLGQAIDVVSGVPPASTLANTAASRVVTAYGDWDGRWVLVGEDEVHADCWCTIPVFYSDRAIASTPGLLEPGRLPDRALSRDDRCDWFPAPLSGLDSVRRVLPSQVLRVSDRTVTARPLPGTVRDAMVDDTVDRLEAMLLACIGGVAAERLVLPLTAGFDSRLLLAVCAGSGRDVLTVTLSHPGMSRADRDQPPQLAAIAGYKHELVRPRGRDPRLGELYDRQVAGHVREQDRAFLVRRQYRWVEAGDVILRGLSLDMTRSRYHRDVPDGGADLQRWVADLEPSPRQRAGLAAYAAWVASDPQPLPMPYRFDLEQGNACWAATTDVALDLLSGPPMEPGNARAYQHAAMSLPQEYRSASRHHVELIRRLCPGLLELPVNPPESRWRHPGRWPGSAQRRLRRVLGGRW